jgi:D-alanyl-D-alanine carboxypeptidase/D-alanyl-D-alanine-endopeptidase (penicillin-binding protein 4)
VLDAKALQTAHVGISIFDPAANKYLYNYQGDKYFVPASNTKLPTCYAAMKYLGDSLVGLKVVKGGDRLFLVPTGDPTFLHPHFSYQPVYTFLKKIPTATMTMNNWLEVGLGNGWSWNDYNEPYLAERSAFPIYGNCLTFSLDNDTLIVNPFIDVSWRRSWTNYQGGLNKFYIRRDKDHNIFREPFSENASFKRQSVPFIPKDSVVLNMLLDTLKNLRMEKFVNTMGINGINNNVPEELTIIHSQPTDSLLKPMMHRSDNFFAEQSLLMVSNEMLGVMNDEKIIDTLLKTDFKDLPQKPRWVDGSGLSRYNLFTPQDFVVILNKMKNEFGMERLKVILPTGGEGTISSYYKADSGYIYGKTGTLSGVVAFSGFLYTKKGKLLIFSTLVNNHQATATEVRRAMEKFLQGVRSKY